MYEINESNSEECKCKTENDWNGMKGCFETQDCSADLMMRAVQRVQTGE